MNFFKSLKVYLNHLNKYTSVCIQSLHSYFGIQKYHTCFSLLYIIIHMLLIFHIFFNINTNKLFYIIQDIFLLALIIYKNSIRFNIIWLINTLNNSGVHLVIAINSLSSLRSVTTSIQMPDECVTGPYLLQIIYEINLFLK